MIECDMDLMENTLIDKELNKVIQLYDICDSMVLIYDQKGQVMKWNHYAQKVLNRDGELIHTNVRTLLPSIYNENNLVIEAEEANRNTGVKTMLNRNNKSCLPVTVKRTSVDINGVFFGVCAILVLNERMSSTLDKEEATNYIEDEFTGKLEYLAKISHDLRVPVNGIYGLTELLEQEIMEEEYQDSFRVMKECCVHMKKMIDRILEYETLSNGVVTLHEEYVDIHRLFENVIAIHKPLAEKKGLQLYINLSKKLPRIVFLDRSKLGAILNNLLSNAIKFTQIGFVSLTITCVKVQSRIMILLISVTDTGIGIDKKKQKAIFQPFAQGDSDINQMYGGTGLGLAIVRQLVVLMKGAMRVNSVQGEGSEFMVGIQVKLEKGGCLYRLERRDLEEHFDEMIEEMRAEFTMDAEKSQYERIMKVKCYNTRESKDEILHNLKKIRQCVKEQNWEKSNVWFETLKYLIPSSQERTREKLLKIELGARRKEIKRTMLALNDFEQELI